MFMLVFVVVVVFMFMFIIITLSLPRMVIVRHVFPIIPVPENIGHSLILLSHRRRVMKMRMMVRLPPYSS